MKSLFSPDNRFMQALSKIWDIMVLNVLFVICSLPVFTIGASLTALYSVTLKMARNEEGYIAAAFLKSWKENFKISTAAWLGLAAVGAAVLLDFRLIPELFPESAFFLRGILVTVLVLYLSVLLVIFPYIARFDNGLRDTVKNAFLIGVLNLPRLAVSAAVYALPVLLTAVCGIQYMIPGWLLFFFSAAARASSVVYRKIFDQYETAENTVKTIG